MKMAIYFLLAAAGVALMAALMAGSARAEGVNSRLDASSAKPPSNPLLADWAGPFGGLPPFDQVEIRHFVPALEAAMAEHLAEIDLIAANPAPPAFENTIAAMERAGGTLDRVRAIYGVWSSTMNLPEFREVEREMAPRLAAFSDRITQNEALFRRIDALFHSPEKDQLSPEQQRLIWLYYTNFVRAGARLDSAAKERLSEMNQQLARLFTEFSQNVLAEESELYLIIREPSQLDGLPQPLINAASKAAQDKGLEGAWVIANTRSAIEPFLTYAANRDLRKQAFELFTKRGDNGGDHDNNGIITGILQLRAERAQLLGYPTHAHWRIENTMAREPRRALELMEAVWKPAVARVREEVAGMQALADAENPGIRIEPWDYRYYAEKARKARYDLDENEVKPYLQLDRLVEGMFWVGGELFGFDFAEINEAPVYHSDVRVWEVTQRENGAHAGLFYFDPYARANKRSGAWMNSYRRQQRLDGEITPLVSNNSNFIQGEPGKPVLISWRDAETLFHEFGHALHGLASNVTYPSLAGTQVARDYVEFPSQLLEHWLATPEVLERFAIHHESGEPLPNHLVARIEKAATFNQGFQTVEFLASGLYDMRIHLEPAHPIDPSSFEKEVLAKYGLPPEIVMRHRPTHFLHIFAGDGYSAGYYSYLWSDVLTADAYQAFLEGSGPYDREVARRLRLRIFSAGNTIDPAEAYRQFRGRDPKIEPLLRKRGFTAASPEKTE
jgi:peptidyl-dipeptidase Dcp